MPRKNLGCYGYTEVLGMAAGFIPAQTSLTQEGGDTCGSFPGKIMWVIRGSK